MSRILGKFFIVNILLKLNKASYKVCWRLCFDLVTYVTEVIFHEQSIQENNTFNF